MALFSRLCVLLSLLVSIGYLSACAQQESGTEAATKETAKSSTDIANKRPEDIDAMTDEEVDAFLAIDDAKIGLQFSNNKAIRVEYADTPQERQLGLMYRRKLCDDCGMLFKFDSTRTGSIWMKNTFVPLDLAYIKQDGTIVDIFQLTPHDLTPVESTSKVLYALEMNQGWFAQHDIRTGDKIKYLP